MTLIRHTSPPLIRVALPQRLPDTATQFTHRGHAPSMSEHSGLASTVRDRQPPPSSDPVMTETWLMGVFRRLLHGASVNACQFHICGIDLLFSGCGCATTPPTGGHAPPRRNAVIAA